MKTVNLIFSVTVLILLSGMIKKKAPESLSDLILYCPPVTSAESFYNSHAGYGMENISEVWKEGIMSDISKQEYHISYNEKYNSYQSPNRKNNIRFIYHENGFTALNRTASVRLSDEDLPVQAGVETSHVDADEWELDLRVSGLSRASAGAAGLDVSMSGRVFNAEGNNANIENENLRIEYTNTEDGMRQDFIIKNRPEGEGSLRLELTAKTDLNFIAGADALIFKNEDGDEKMRYSSLKCWDANGKELRGYFERGNGRNSINIIVNDAEAAYPVTIDPLSSSYSWIKGGPQAFARFGYSVSTAGDVNGDGYSDVIVGAFLYDNGFTDEGLAQVFYGSATGLSTTAAWSKEGDDASASFGWSVSTAGDVNGDGYSDVIVGARFYNSRQGAALVYHGSASGLSSTANWIREGYTNNTYFAHCVSTAGDVNGDGYSDVIVSAIYDGNLPSLDGKVFMYKGSSSGLSTTSSQTLTGPHHNDLFGNSISTAGDINGDGYSDIIIGTPHFTNTESVEGKAFIYKGENTAAGLNSTPVWEVESNIAQSRFGYSVATGGDVNGDGYSDVIIGSNTYSNSETSEGRVQLFYGNSSGGSTTAAWSYESNYAGAKLGSSVNTAGDVNGDGYADIIAGAPEYSNNQTQEGRAYVFLGSASGPGAGYDWTYEDNTANAWFGISVCTAGDINGDGFSDVIVGSPQVGVGAAFVFNGFAAGLASTSNWSYENNQVNSQLGYSVSIAGDVNGDGYADVIVGAPFFDNGQTDEGRAYVYHGSLSGLSAAPDWTKEFNEDSAQFGFAVRTAGDINGDGYSDVIVSANLWNGTGYTDQGRVWVFNGSSTGLSSSASWNDNSRQDNAHFGSSVSAAGDVNGDGFSDIIIGADNYNSGESGEGKVFVYYGSTSGLTANPVWTAEGNQANAGFGNSVSTGDVNGDGISDIIVGAYKYDNGQTDEGAVFLYHGSLSGLPLTHNIMLESDQASAQFGYSVSTAGDVNADSFFDIIVGANLYDNVESNEGRAYIYNGSASGVSATPSRTLEVNQAGAQFGKSVCNAGDVNGDGYADVIISTPAYDNGQTNEGRVYLYYGSQTGIPASSAWFYEPDQANTDFGLSISTAGDINGDGYSDIIIGSPLQNNGDTDEGLIFAFYGNLATCKRANLRQFDNGTNNVVCSGNNTGTDGGVRFRIYANSPFGRADGTIVFERRRAGTVYSGTVITNSTEYNNSGNFEDLTLAGKNVNYDMSGLNSTYEYRWRARVRYDPSNNPYQKFGPWKYFSNYIPIPAGDFRPRVNTLSAPSLTLSAFIQGFYDPSSNTTVRDTVTVYVREYNSPYAVLDSARFYLSISGSATGTFSNTAILNGAMYYLQLKHRNSIETWNTGSAFVNGSQTYDFTQSALTAYGSNQIQVDVSPQKFAVYGGDVNQDGTVDATDVSTIDNDASNFVAGYVVTDITGDNFVDGTDFAIADNNAANFVNVIRP